MLYGRSELLLLKRLVLYRWFGMLLLWRLVLRLRCRLLPDKCEVNTGHPCE